MPDYFVYDSETSIQYERRLVKLKKGRFINKRVEGLFGPSWKDPKNDIHTIIYGTNPNNIKLLHSKKGFKRKLPYRVGTKLLQTKVMIGTNLKFDLGFIWHDKYFQQWLKNGGQIWDCMQVQFLLSAQRWKWASLAEMQQRVLGIKTKVDSISRCFRRCIGADEIIKFRKKCKRLWRDYEKYGIEDGRTPMLIMQKQYKLAKSMGMLPIIKLYNEYILSITMMEVNGMVVDMPAVEHLYQEFNMTMLEHLETAQKIAAGYWTDERLPPLNINSPQHSSLLLFGGEITVQVNRSTGTFIKAKNSPNFGKEKFKKVDEIVYVKGMGVDPKLSTLSKTGYYSTAKDIVDVIHAKSKSEVAKEYCKYLKLAATFKQKISTYLNALLYKSVDGIIRANYNTTEVVTGRLSSSSPNAQNWPAHGEFGASIPKLLIAPSGWSCVNVDFSQLETYCRALLTREPSLIADLINGRDFHIQNMCWGYELTYEEGVKLAKVDKDPLWVERRASAKSVTFGEAYGQMPESMAKRTGWSEAIIEKIYAAMYENYPLLVDFDKKVQEEVRLSAKLINKNMYSVKDGRDSKDAKGVPKKFLGNLELLPIRTQDKKSYYFINNEHRHVGVFRSITGKRYSFLEYGSQYKNGDIKGYYKPTQMKNYSMQGCLHGDTHIITKEYGKTTIKELVGQDITVWTDGGEWSKAGCVFAGEKRLIKLTFRDGNSIECSPEHKFKYVNPSTLYEGWVTAGEIVDKISRGLRVAIKLGAAIEVSKEVSFRRPALAKTPVNYKDLSFDDIGDYVDMGKLIGRIASDGWVRKAKDVSLTVAEHEYTILPYLESIAARVGHYSVQKIKRAAREQELTIIRFCSTALAREIPNGKLDIPPQCWLNKDLMRGYLSGYFDGDGTVNKEGRIVLTFGNQPHKIAWARSIQLALRLFGIRSRVKCYSDRTLVSVMKADSPIFRDEIGFINPRKQAKLANCGTARNSHNIAYVSAAVDTGEKVEMYDVVNSDNKMFCANGLVTHNTAGDIQAATSAAMFQLLIRNPDKVKLVNEVHDSKWFLIKDEYLSCIVNKICSIMRNTDQLLKDRFNIDAPFRFEVEAKVGRNFAEMEVYKIKG